MSKYVYNTGRVCPECGTEVEYAENGIDDYYCPECNILLMDEECMDSFAVIAEDMAINEHMERWRENRNPY